MTYLSAVRLTLTESIANARNRISWRDSSWNTLSTVRLRHNQFWCDIHTIHCRLRKKRYYGFLVLPILLVIIWLLWPILARIEWSSEQSWYELGWYGIAPVRYYRSLHYKSTQLPVTRFEFLQKDSRCTQQKIFLAPRGPHVGNPGGMILDADGELIWRQPTLGGDTQDLRPQKYMNETIVTLWSGYAREGRKEGAWYLFSQKYDLLHEIFPSGRYLYGDMHEFGITPDNTALISLYYPVQADLSSIGGPSNGWLLENIFQEIDVETREVLFEWNATNHFNLGDTAKKLRGCHNSPSFAYGGCGYDRDTSFDFYHLNSVEKDEKGNYLISGRNTHTLSYLDGKTGDVLWNLGGENSDFEDLSSGGATNFSWQHDARWRYNGSSISLFDNSNHDYSDPNVQSRGMVIDIDVDARTVSLRHSYYHPRGMRSFSQGDVQLVEETGNVLVGWGRNPAFTEFSEDGQVLCDARFGATAFFNFGAITSYRVFHGDWIGMPPERRIDTAMEDHNMYVSWNGDTEVDRWQVEAAEEVEGSYKIIAQVFRHGFETKIPLQPSDRYKFFRASGLHKNGTVLGASKPLEGDISEPWLSPLAISIIAVVTFNLVLVVVVFLSAVACIRWRRRRRQTRGSGYKPVPGSEDPDFPLEGITLPPDTRSPPDESPIDTE